MQALLKEEKKALPIRAEMCLLSLGRLERNTVHYGRYLGSCNLQLNLFVCVHAYVPVYVLLCSLDEALVINYIL